MARRLSLLATLAVLLGAPSASAEFDTQIFHSEFNRNLAAADQSWDAKQFTSTVNYVYFNGWDTVDVSNGNLHVVAERVAPNYWHTAWITTKPSIAPVPPLKYVSRAKVASGYGTWSSPGWSYRNPYGGGGCGELDNLEQLGRLPNVAFQTAHWCGGSASKSWTASEPLANAYHRYALLIYGNRAEWRVDGVTTNITTAIEAGQWPFLNPTTFNIDLRIGGWGYDPPASLTRAQMDVDWFRVYK